VSAYNFLGLVNDVNRRLNEVELTSGNFASANGFYASAKDSINSAIRYIGQSQYEWPFNHVEETEVLVPGTIRYAYPADAKTIDFDSFRIKRNSTFSNTTQKLRIISYEDYLENYLDDEYNTSNTSIRKIPERIFRAPDQKFGVHPAPDNAYELVYEYYRLPVDLVSATDVPTLPEQFRSIVVDGAMHYAYTFRGNTQDASIYLQKFEEGIKDMRSLYINRYDYIRDTRVARNTYTSNMRVG
jgi:hypothetical protein